VQSEDSLNISDQPSGSHSANPSSSAIPSTHTHTCNNLGLKWWLRRGKWQPQGRSTCAAYITACYMLTRPEKPLGHSTITKINRRGEATRYTKGNLSTQRSKRNQPPPCGYAYPANSSRSLQNQVHCSKRQQHMQVPPAPPSSAICLEVFSRLLCLIGQGRVMTHSPNSTVKHSHDPLLLVQLRTSCRS
jgi:hypothetical protein